MRNEVNRKEFETASKRRIRFECAAPEADSVAIAGSFNNW